MPTGIGFDRRRPVEQLAKIHTIFCHFLKRWQARASTTAASTTATAATATAAEATEELRKGEASVSERGRVRKLAPSDGWQAAPAAVALRVVEDEQEDTVEDEEFLLEEDLSDEEADSAGPVKWVVPAWEVCDRVGWRGGLKSLERASECASGTAWDAGEAWRCGRWHAPG
jgi:hypothetical protein